MRMLAVLSLLAVLAVPRSSAEGTDELRFAFQAARDSVGIQRQAAFNRAMAEAMVVKDLISTYASVLVYFPGLMSMPDGPFPIVVGGSPAWQTLSQNVAFLRLPPGTTITVAPGAQRAAQFEALKAEYAAALQRAGTLLKGFDASPLCRADYRGYVDWGAQTSVIDPSEGAGADYKPVLTLEQKTELLK